MPLREFVDRYPALVGHLCRAARAGRLAHAYLLTGEADGPLREFARGWFQVCACASRTAEGDACGRCPSCTELAAGRYPYLQELQPVSKSRVIRIDEVRELERQLYLTTDGRPRFALILDADRMNDNAQNAFLKTLEEPVPGTTIALATANPAALRPTVRSRCQWLALRDNRLAYCLDDSAAFFGALAALRPEAGGLVATRAAGQVLATLAGFKARADEEAATFRHGLLANLREVDPEVREQIDEQTEAFGAARYLAHRAAALGALHAWFAQEYLRAAGVPAPAWPQAELYAAVPGHADRPPLSVNQARRCLRLAEELLATLQGNAEQGLAVEDFCEQICRLACAA